MEKADVDRWLEAYVAAWKSYDREQIAELFADDVSYRYHPYDSAVEGRQAVVESWLGEGDHTGASTRDEVGTYDAVYAPWPSTATWPWPPARARTARRRADRSSRSSTTAS